MKLLDDAPDRPAEFVAWACYAVPCLAAFALVLPVLCLLSWLGRMVAWPIEKMKGLR